MTPTRNRPGETTMTIIEKQLPHDTCHAFTYTDELTGKKDTIYSLRDGCAWDGHQAALDEAGFCPVCQH